MVPLHFNATPAKVRTRAVQGRGRYARTCRRFSIPRTSPPPPTFSGGGSWAEPFWKTAHGRIGFPNAMHRVWGPFPTEAVRCRASPSGFRPPPLVPGLFWFRARVILPTDGPTRPIQRLPVRGKVPPFPHPEPPLLLVVLGVAPSVGPNRGLSPSNPMENRVPALVLSCPGVRPGLYSLWSLRIGRLTNLGQSGWKSKAGLVNWFPGHSPHSGLPIRDADASCPPGNEGREYIGRAILPGE